MQKELLNILKENEDNIIIDFLQYQYNESDLKINKMQIKLITDDIALIVLYNSDDIYLQWYININKLNNINVDSETDILQYILFNDNYTSDFFNSTREGIEFEDFFYNFTFINSLCNILKENNKKSVIINLNSLYNLFNDDDY